jgi:hypothetical protein
MKKLINKSEKVEEVAEKAKNRELDELSEIRNFIKRRTLENRVLKELTDELLNTPPYEIKKSKSA